MDKTIRRNQICVVGLPRCDFVFSSTRTCFIAYGFRDCALEMGILRHLLGQRGIQPIEAGGALAPGQNAFCAKICSKIITSQFCVVLINNEESAGREIPNANVNMEYGLMLGFNKYVIPFQRASQTLPFNVGGLDTIKYGNADFERLAIIAIDQAIRETQQDAPPPLSPDQILGTFLLTKKALVTPINNQGESTIFQLGWSLGFNLLNDFSGMTYMYFGNFTSLRPEVLVWRVKLLIEILDERRATLHSRVPLGIATEETVRQAEQILRSMQIWVVVTSNEDKKSVKVALGSVPYSVGIFSLDDVQSELENLGRIGA
jgi:hypothetical protein